MANIITAPESGIYFDGNTAGTGVIPVLTGNASGVAIQYDGYAGITISSSATGANYQDRFSIEGENGRLFGVSDQVTGSVFSVNDGAGLPLIDVDVESSFSKITLGQYGTDAIVISGSSVQITGSNVVTEGHLSDENYVTSDEILTHLLTVDGANSNLDADKLDGQQGSYYLDYGNFSNTPTVNDVSETNLLNRLAALDSSDTIYIGDAGDDTTVVVRGTLQVDGATTTINSNTLSIGDNQIVLNNDVTGTPTQNAGIIVQRGTSTSASLIWDEANDYWKAGKVGSEVQLALTNGTYSGLRAQSTTKGDVGLGNVTNESKATMFTSPSFTGDVSITDDTPLFIKSSSNGAGAGIKFSDQTGTYGQQGTLTFRHSDTASYGSGASFILATSEATSTILADGKLMYGEGIYSKPATGTGAGTRKDTNWDTAYTDRNKWDGGSTGLNASTGRTSLGLGSAATQNTSAFAPATGSTSIVSLGTVVTGDWNAGVISSTYLDADTAHLSGTQTFSGAKTFSSGLNISVSTSNTQLKLKRTGTATGEFNIYTNNDTLFFNNVGQSSFPMVIDEDGNVGIGTTSPSYRLSVDDNSVTNIPKTLLQFDASSIADNGGYNIDFRTSSNDLANRYVARIRGIRESSGALSQLSFWTESGSALEQRMTIRASGNVGIGTTSPEVLLHVGTATLGTAPDTNADIISSGGITIDDNRRLSFDTNYYVHGNIRYATSGTTEAKLEYQGHYGHNFITRSSSKMVISGNTGNVGIGTTSPSYKLEVRSVDANDDVAYIHHDSASQTSGTVLKVRSDAGNSSGYSLLDVQNNSVNALYVRGDGNVGIGTTSPSHKLEVGLTSTVALANQPAEPLFVSNDAQSVDGRVFISVKHDVVNTASAVGAGFKMTAAAVTSGTASYDDSLIFLRSAGSSNVTVHSAPRDIKFYVDNHATNAGSGANYDDLGDLALTIAEDTKVGIGTAPSAKLHVADTTTMTTGQASVEVLKLQRLDSTGDIKASTEGHISMWATDSNSNYEWARISWLNDNTSDSGPENEGSLHFWTNKSGTLTRALSIDHDQNATFAGNIIAGGAVYPATNAAASLGLSNKQWAGLDLSSSSAITWGNGDAEIIEGETNNYSLTFKTYDGSSNSAALRLDGDNTATFTGDVTVSGDLTVNGTISGQLTKKISGDGSATTFTVTHSFGTPHVMTQLLDYGDNGTGATYEVVQATVKRNSDNAIDVLFGVAPTSSEDYLVLITKMPAIS